MVPGIKKYLLRGLLYALIFLLSSGCSSDDEEPEKKSEDLPQNVTEYISGTDGLKDYYTVKGYFNIGAAINPNSLDNQEATKFIRRHFTTLTAENVMKWSTLQPTEGTFRFEYADKIVNFAQANNMKVRGHTLVWHNQVPDWIFRDGSGTASKELVLQRMRTHITTVMNRYKGKVYAWDVVNEAIDDGSDTYRASRWYTICGEDYIVEAFKAARAADPSAKLFYNDYSEVNPAKRDKIFSLLQKLKNQNLIDGMGMQGHWNIDYPSDELLTDGIEKYSSLGIELQITELDVSVYPSNSDPQTIYTAELAQKQAIAFGRFFCAFRKNKNLITGITFWGLADNYSWLDNFPVTGRKNYPFLFDATYLPKPAYFMVITF